jgi:hypothetical protein
MPADTTPESTRLAVRIVPRASREVVVGMRGGVLLVRVTAAPVEGAANAALLRLVAKRLHVAGRAVRIVSGLTSKVKVIEVEGLAEAETLRRLGVPPARAASEA